MHPLTFLALAAVATVALAGGQYYVPRAYYTIDSEGHESIPVPLRRLRRSPIPYPPPPSDNSWSNAASGSSSWSNANSGSNGGYRPPSHGIGASAPRG